jgi:ABC-type transport system substrate-binding protein
LLLLLAAGGLSACSRAAEPPASSQSPVTLRIGIAVPPTGTAGSGVGGFINNFVSDSLVGIGWDGRPVDRLVADWEWSANELELKLRVRPNLKFHDGTAIDRAYFRQSLETILKAPQTPGTNVSYQSVTAVELDPTTEDRVVIKLSRPEAFLLTDLANSTLPHPTNPQIGTGPFRTVTREPKARLAAFDGYYRGRPKVDFIEVEDFEEQRAAWVALMRGEIDAVHEISPNAVDFVQAQGQTVVRTFPFVRPYYFQMVFNVRHPELKKAAVRQALSYAVDRQAIIDIALNRQGTVAEGPIWPFHWAYSTAQKAYTHNTEAATLRLDSAGLTLARKPKSGQMPSRLRIRCLTVAKEARYEKIALVLQKQLYEIGVDMEIETLPGKELVGRLFSGNFDAVLIERTSGRSLAWTYLTFHSSQSPSGYTAADGVLERLRRTTSDAGVRTAVSDLQQIFHDDPPAIFIAWPKVARGVTSKFEVPEEGGRDVMSSIWLWRPAGQTR